jgi:hypothetical protein
VFKILSLNQFLSHHFYHKQQQCSYIFKKPIGKSFLFTESNPEVPYRKKEMSLSLGELFISPDVVLLKGDENTTVSVYDYFVNRYDNFKSRLNEIKTESEIRQLLEETDPFLSSSMKVEAANIKTAKQELLNLLEKDFEKIVGFRKGSARDIGGRAEETDFPTTAELEKYKFTRVDLQVGSDGPQKEFADLLEKTYLRSQTIIRKGLKDKILPLLEFLSEDFLNNRLLALAGETDAYLLKSHCRIEAVTDERSLPSVVDKAMNKASFARADQDNGSFVVILMGAFSKVDGQMMLIKIKIDLPGELNRRQQKNIMKSFRNPGLYSEISYGLNEFLKHRSYKIDTSDIKRELKKKIETLLKSPGIIPDYKKLLVVLDRREIYFILTALANKRVDLIKEIVLISIEHYLKEIESSENLYSDLNFIKSIKSYADNAKVTFKESDWEGVLGIIETKIKSPSIDSKLLTPVLEDFFEGSPFLTVYRNFSKITGVSSEEEYILLSLSIYNHNNWINQELNPQTKNALIKFLVQEIQFRLDRPDNIDQANEIKDVLDKLNLKPTADDLKPLITNISGSLVMKESLIGEEGKISSYFEVLKLLFPDFPHLATYDEFSQICTARERLLDDEYVAVALKIFYNDNWTDSAQLNGDTKNIIKNFIMQQIVNLLPAAQNKEKTHQNKIVLERLKITLTPQDINPLLDAIDSSPLKDHQNQEMKNGHGMEGYFEILSEFLCDSVMLEYYRQFAQIKMGQYNFSNFHFVTTAIKILDQRNWQNNTLSPNIRQEIKKLYFSTFLNQKLSRDDKVFNLDILHNRLKIPITKQERNELGEYVKDRIEGLVDLVDAMEELVEEATG